jgi:hypothetical protein
MAEGAMTQADLWVAVLIVFVIWAFWERGTWRR